MPLSSCANFIKSFNFLELQFLHFFFFKERSFLSLREHTCMGAHRHMNGDEGVEGDLQEDSPLSEEPYSGFNPTTLRSQLELKSSQTLNQLSHPGAPVSASLKQ